MNVFISYAHQDAAMAKRLVDELHKTGVQVWFDQREVLPGDNLPAKVGEALEISDAMIVLVSPQAMKSNWVRGAISYAIGEERFAGKLIPVMVKPTRETPPAFKSLRYVRSTDPKNAARTIANRLQKNAS